jgi:hypothetical protein
MYCTDRDTQGELDAAGRSAYCARETTVSKKILGEVSNMAGKVISTAYREKIEEVGVFSILERVKSGDTLQNIAKSMGMSRPFLSTFLNRDRYTAEALCIARAIAATKRLTAHPGEGEQLGARKWLESVPMLHLAALKAQRQGESSIALPAVDTTSLDRLTAALRAGGIHIPKGASD